MSRFQRIIPWTRGATVETPGGAYTCRGCGRSFDLQYHVCPECGGFSVEPGGEGSTE